MSRHPALPAFLLATLLLLCAGPASATGLGVSAGFEHTALDFGENGFSDFDIQNLYLAFMLDTAVNRDKVLNYRAQVGLSMSLMDEGGRGYGFVTKHTLGFGLHRSDTVRLWAGPTARLAIGTLEEAFTLSFGGGAELGLNLRLSDGFALAITTGYQASRFVLVTGGESGGDDGIQHVFGLNVAGLFLTSSERRPSAGPEPLYYVAP